jgi:hypothetical protein
VIDVSHEVEQFIAKGEFFNISPGHILEYGVKLRNLFQTGYPKGIRNRTPLGYPKTNTSKDCKKIPSILLIIASGIRILGKKKPFARLCQTSHQSIPDIIIKEKVGFRVISLSGKHIEYRTVGL